MRRRHTTDPDAGFTLIELVIVVAVMPIVVGAIAVGILSVFSLQTSVSARLTDSADEQLTAVNYQNDVQSAASLTTASSPASAPAPCGTGYQVLGLQLGNGNLISYSAAPASTGTSYTLSRNECPSGGQPTTKLVARDMPASIVNAATPAVTVTCASTSPTCSNTPPQPYAVNWQPTLGVTGVKFQVTEPGSGFNYQLDAVPISAASSTQLAQPSNPSTGCGFASKGTGQYAQTLCFINFAPWNTQTKATGVNTCNAAQSGFSTPLPMAAAISNSPFTLNFCMSVKAYPNGNPNSPITGPTSAGSACGVAARNGYFDITASPLPTYSCPPQSQAFLGNNGFYTGVPNNPALYEVNQGSTAIINFTNISLVSPNGVASNWQLVTGDAESTDPNESISWNTNNNAVHLNLIPNSVDASNNVTSEVGNACNSTPPGYDPTHLTGVGTSTVTCTTGSSTDKTGTPMLEALSPSSLTVTLVGGGLEATFLAVLLP